MLKIEKYTVYPEILLKDENILPKTALENSLFECLESWSIRRKFQEKI